MRQKSNYPKDSVEMAERCAVHPVVLLPHPTYLHTQRIVMLQLGWQPPRHRCPGLVFVVCRRGNRQLLADRLDPMVSAMRIDK